MSFLGDVVSWFGQATHWRGTTGVPRLFLDQMELSLAVVGAASLVGGSAGLLLGHFRRGGLLAVNAANAARAVPTLGLLTLLAIIPAISLNWGGFLASFLALAVLAVPPIMTNTYVGVRSVDADTTDAAKGMGMGDMRLMTSVELPLALPSVLAGVRVAAVEVVATSTLAAYVSYSDLGTILLRGLGANSSVTAFCGALLVAVTAGVVAVAFGALQRLCTPAPLRARTPSLLRAGVRGGRSSAAAYS
jgi:osmoprotectant transport system permease protein